MKTKLYFLLCFICCGCAVAYIYLFAEDRFMSKSQFSIIVQDQSSADVSAGLLSLLGSSGSSATPDMQATIGFIHSADLLVKLEEEFNLLEHYKSPKNDVIYKLEEDASNEDRFTYYRKRIIAEFNPATGLIDLSVETYDAELSFKLSQKILLYTEEFINSLNSDVANERLNFVGLELERAQQGVEKVEKELLAFQSKHQIIQPEVIIAARLEAIQGLKLEKIDREIKLSTLKSTSSKSPLIPEMQATIRKLGDEIKSQEEVLAGSDQKKLNKILSDYKALQLNLTFAIKLREGAEILLEQTRAEAITKSRFFSVIQNPYLSDEYTNPRRLYLSITMMIIIVLSFYVLRAFAFSVIDRV